MIEIKNKCDCCGCGACDNICPQNCITMIEDDEGFLYPTVDQQRCVNCNLCVHVCPMIEAQNVSHPANAEKHTAYAAYAKDKNLRLHSSSGGVFSLSAEWILQQGGIVFGAAYDKNFLVHHIAIEKIEDLPVLRGSKYLQSRTEKAFQQVRDYLNAGKMVLYTGTACQIAGLKKYLRKEYPNLYTIDVLCHGVPSPKVWEKYVGDVQSNSHLRNINFRDKKHGWKQYSVTMKYEDDLIYSQSYWENPYMRMFLKNICLRPSCHACKYKEMDRPSDITIGDAWGIDSYMPEMDDDNGTSVVITHSHRGSEMLEAIEEKMVVRKAELDQILPPSADSRKSVTPHMNRKKFFCKLSTGESFQDLEKCLHPTKIERIKHKGKKLLRWLMSKENHSSV